MSRYRPRSEHGLLLVAAGCFVGTAALLTDRTTAAVLVAGLVVAGLALVFWDQIVRAHATLGGGACAVAEQTSQRQDESSPDRRRRAA